VSGFAVFGLGYALLFSDIGTDFSTAGLSNRTEIASALGASCTLVAVAGIACSVPRSQNARKKAFGLMIGLICGVNCLAVNGIGFFWGTASSQQQLILRSVAANVRALPRGSVLLLDGFCRYSGPGVVFETDWDTSGAIELTLRDYSLVGDVVSPNLHFENDAAETTMSGKVEGQYPYGSQLLVYNVRHNLMSSLPSKEAALGYLRAINPTGDSGCPAAKDGYGEKVF
jgi:hypothetical protein